MRELIVEFRGERRKRSSSRGPKSRALVTVVVLVGVLLLFAYHSGSGPQIVADPAQVTFLPVPVGSSSDIKTITIQNTGSTTIHIESPRLAGAAAADFFYSDGCTNQSMGTGQSCSLQVHMIPTAAGERVAQLTLVSDSTNAPARQIVLMGEGTPPSDLRADPLPVDFAHATDQPATATVTFTNPGPVAMAISAISIEGSAEFATARTCEGKTLQPGESCQESVSYAPASPQASSGYLLVSYNQSQTLRIPLQSQAQVTPLPAATMVVTPRQIALQGVSGGPAPSVPLEIRNSGNAPLHVSSIRANQPDQFFVLLGDCSQTPIPRGGSCSLTVQSTLKVARNINGSIDIASDGGQAHVAVSAAISPAPLPTVVVSPSQLEMKPKTPNLITVRNSGSVPLHIRSLTTSSPDQLSVSTSGTQSACAPGMQLAPASSCRVSILLRSVPATPLHASFEIADDASDSPQRVDLYTKAPPLPPAQIQVDPPRIDFRGTAGSGNNRTSLTIRNRGGLPLHVDAPRINQGNQFFTVLGDCSSAAIMPGQVCTLTVQVAGARAVQGSGFIELDSDGGKAVVPVSADQSPPSRPLVSVSPPRLEVLPGRPNFITVTNKGDGPLHIQDFTTSSSDQFVIATGGIPSPCVRGMQLAPASSCQLGVALRQGSNGNAFATFELVSDATNGPQEVTLYARVAPPPPPTTPTSPAQIQVSPPRIDFRGSVGNVNGRAALTIGNSGGLPLHVSPPKITQQPPFFAVSGDCSSAPILPGRQCAVIVQLTATGAGETARTITYYSAAAPSLRGAGSIELDSDGGRAVVPVSVLITAAQRPVVSLSPPRLELVPGTANFITVTNSGNAPAHLQNFATTVPSQFVVTTGGTQQPCGRGLPLPPGGSCQVGIVFRPLAKGATTAIFELSDDAADSPQQVTLVARAGTPPFGRVDSVPARRSDIPALQPAAKGQIAVEPRGIEFKGQLGNVRNTIPLNVMNNGRGPMQLARPTVKGQQFFTVLGDCWSAPIMPGHNCMLNLRLTLTGVGRASGMLVLTGDSGSVQIPVSADVSQPPPR